MALLLVVLRRCKIGSGSSEDSSTREALSLGAACLLKVLKVFGFFQQVYSLNSISEPARLALDMEAADLAQINQTDREEVIVQENTKKDGWLYFRNSKICLRKSVDSITENLTLANVRFRSLIENMQQQIQLALQSGAKVWPELYSMPQLYEMLCVGQLRHLPASRQRLVIRQLYSPFVQFCPSEQVETACRIVSDLIIGCINQLSVWWQQIEEGEFESEKDELLHYYRTQTLTKDFIEFLATAVKTNNQVSFAAKQMIQVFSNWCQ